MAHARSTQARSSQAVWSSGLSRWAGRPPPEGLEGVATTECSMLSPQWCRRGVVGRLGASRGVMSNVLVEYPQAKQKGT
ncbi:putative beta-glucosidase G [Venturia inaequalis]|nr:putative beta-glucosidase G [Venturia inaequalis]